MTFKELLNGLPKSTNKTRIGHALNNAGFEQSEFDIFQVDWRRWRTENGRLRGMGHKSFYLLDAALKKHGVRTGWAKEEHKHYPINVESENGRIWATCRGCKATLMVSSWRTQKPKSY